MKKFLLSFVVLFFCTIGDVCGQNNIWHEEFNTTVGVGLRPMKIGIASQNVVDVKLELFGVGPILEDISTTFHFARSPYYQEWDFIGGITGLGSRFVFESMSGGPVDLVAMALLVSSMNFHFPLIDDWLETNVGWSLLKISKFTDPENTYYSYESPTGEWYGCDIYDRWFVNGSFNIGLSAYFEDFFINPYWEYNFGYYKFTQFLAKIDLANRDYPYRGFCGNCFGIRIGYQF